MHAARGERDSLPACTRSSPASGLPSPPPHPRGLHTHTHTLSGSLPALAQVAAAQKQLAQLSVENRALRVRSALLEDMLIYWWVPAAGCQGGQRVAGKWGSVFGACVHVLGSKQRCAGWGTRECSA